MLYDGLCTAAFGDGGIDYYNLYQLVGKEIKIPYSLEKSSYGSAHCTYYGYKNNASTLIFSADPELEDSSKYATYEEGVEGFFGGIGIKADCGLREISFEAESLVSNMFTYKWTSEDEYDKSKEESGKIYDYATFTQQAKDYFDIESLIKTEK